jgi:hypothetical protein
MNFSTVRDSMPEGATKPGGVAICGISAGLLHCRSVVAGREVDVSELEDVVHEFRQAIFPGARVSSRLLIGHFRLEGIFRGTADYDSYASETLLLRVTLAIRSSCEPGR